MHSFALPTLLIHMYSSWPESIGRRSSVNLFAHVLYKQWFHVHGKKLHIENCVYFPHAMNASMKNLAHVRIGSGVSIDNESSVDYFEKTLFIQGFFIGNNCNISHCFFDALNESFLKSETKFVNRVFSKFWHCVRLFDCFGSIDWLFAE